MNKILVVGAGPVGITCAIELAKRKFDVVLVESGGERFDPIVNGAGAFNQNNIKLALCQFNSTGDPYRTGTNNQNFIH